MKYFFALFISFISFLSFSQETKKVKIKNKEDNSIEVFYVLISNDTIKHGIYNLLVDNKLKIEVHYKNGLKEGVWTEYNTFSNKKKEEGIYINDKKEGIWKSFQENGSDILSQGNYINDKREGDWILYQKNGKDLKSVSTYINDLREGVYTEFNEKGDLIEKGSYFHDTRMGEWEFQYYNQILKYNFKNQIPFYFKNEKILKEAIEIINITENDSTKFFLDSPILNNWELKEYHDFLMKNLQYPEIAVEEFLTGKVYIAITIDENSIAKDFTIIKGVPKCSECDNEALRVLKLIPQNWKAAVYNGTPISGTIVMTISFRLE